MQLLDCVYALQSNRLVKIENLECLVMLEQLYLSDNGIETIEGLDSLVSSSLTGPPHSSVFQDDVYLAQPSPW